VVPGPQREGEAGSGASENMKNTVGLLLSERLESKRGGAVGGEGIGGGDITIGLLGTGVIWRG